MRREWTPEDMIACWTLVEDDWRLVGNKTGSTRLGFALLLKFFELEGRIPRHFGELPRQTVDYVAEQVKVISTEVDVYDWTGRSIKYHRVQIREGLGFRECSVEDEARLSSWLAEDVCQNELGEERQREALLAHCRAERLEPPGPSRVDRVLAAGRAAAEQRFCTQTVARLSAKAIERLEELAAAARGDDVTGGRGLLAELKADPWSWPTCSPAGGRSGWRFWSTPRAAGLERRPEEAVFPGRWRDQPVDGKYIGEQLRQAAELAGIPLERPLHTLRHSYARALRRVEAPLETVQAALDHSNWPPPPSICASWRARRTPGGPSLLLNWGSRLRQRRLPRLG